MVSDWQDSVPSGRVRGSTLSWNSELQLALEKFHWVSPVSSLDHLEVGEVLLSKSGNIRLLIGVNRSADGERLLFLSRLKSGAVRLESAEANRIAADRVLARVSRRDGNPLMYYQHIAENLSAYPAVLQNTETLLLSGYLGAELQSELSSFDGELATIYLGVSLESGAILSVGTVASAADAVPVGLQVRADALAKDEYIENALFYGDENPTVRTALLAACVFANTLQNAKNLVALQLASQPGAVFQ